MPNGLINLEEFPSTWKPWKVSAKWITKRWDCTMKFITSKNGCGGCCHGHPNYWPPQTEHPEPLPGVPGSEIRCSYLGVKGCTLSMRDKPIGCMLTPMMLNDKDTLVVFNRFMFPVVRKHMCKDACGTGPMLIDTLKDQFIEIFGESQWSRVRRDVTEGRDSVFYLSPLYQKEFNREFEAAQNHELPVPRTTPFEIDP